MASEPRSYPGPQTEALFDEFEQALGLLSTLTPGVEIDGVHPLRMARRMEHSITEQIHALEHQIGVHELTIATLREALRVGTGVPAPFRQRIVEAWRVIRGVINVASVRQYAHREAERADREMNAHSATLQRVEEERKAIGAELQRLRDELAKARANESECRLLMNEAVDLRTRSLADAERHAREHIARADALNRRILQMEQDAKLELQVWYNPKAEPGTRWERERNYPPGTVLEKRNAADQPIARSLDGGKTWHEVKETIVVSPQQE
ncbi:MAG: hypothetical protein IT519_11575 [Burkholderiales bacterium]|nr:hypothetical protein [Burkholderiales bacterium]